MQLLILLAIVHAFSSLLNADDSPVDAAAEKLACSAIACASLVALAWWIGQLRRHATDTIRLWTRRGEQFHAVMYLLSMMVMFGVLDFAQIVHANFQLSRFFLADDLVVGLALVLPLLASWVCFGDSYRLDATTITAQRCHVVWLQARHLLLLPLVPIFLLTGVGDVNRILLSQFSSNVEVGRGCAVVVCLAAVVGIPWILRGVWPTCRLGDSPNRFALEQAFASQGVRIRDILCWDTSGRMANAAVAGFLPSLRYLFVTDELLRRLRVEELRAIAAHEAAHLKLHHLRRLAVSLAIPFLVLAIVARPDSPWSWLPQVGVPTITVAILAAWAYGHSRWAKQLEYEADLFACQSLSRSGDRIDASALRQFTQALLATDPRPEGDWLHPRPDDRIRRLARWSVEPQDANRFQSRLKRLSWLHFAVVTSLLAIALIMA